MNWLKSFFTDGDNQDILFFQVFNDILKCNTVNGEEK